MAMKSPGKDGSDIFKDGYLQLAAAVCVRAIYDLRSANLIKALDSLTWWITDGPTWLDALGIIQDEDCVFTLLEKLGDERL
jgi:hypothetical protein